MCRGEEGVIYHTLTCLHKTNLLLESFHTGGKLSDLVLETLWVAEEINKYLSLPTHLMGTIFKNLEDYFTVKNALENMETEKENKAMNVSDADTSIYHFLKQSNTWICFNIFFKKILQCIRDIK
jgi:hypothetical protein